MSMATRWWELQKNETQVGSPKAICKLCVHACEISLGKAGYCGVRKHTEQGLISPFLGKFTSLAVDPIEKKPLYHWKRGTFIFSLGGLGCTMRCPFCQNHNIAQPTASPKNLPRLTSLPPQELVPLIKKLKVPSVAFTYNEPTLQAEYIIAVGESLRESNISVALVTNGMISQAALEDLSPWVDAFNIDVKSFNPHAYKRMGGSLEKVKSTVEYLLEQNKHIELTTLVVPEISDNEEECAQMVAWIASLSKDIPLHFSRYFPAHKYTAPPTELALLQKLQQHAKAHLTHVHLGNIHT